MSREEREVATSNVENFSKKDISKIETKRYELFSKQHDYVKDLHNKGVASRRGLSVYHDGKVAFSTSKNSENFYTGIVHNKYSKNLDKNIDKILEPSIFSYASFQIFVASIPLSIFFTSFVGNFAWILFAFAFVSVLCDNIIKPVNTNKVNISLNSIPKEVLPIYEKFSRTDDDNTFEKIFSLPNGGFFYNFGRKDKRSKEIKGIVPRIGALSKRIDIISSKLETREETMSFVQAAIDETYPEFTELLNLEDNLLVLYRGLNKKLSQRRIAQTIFDYHATDSTKINNAFGFGQQKYSVEPLSDFDIFVHNNTENTLVANNASDVSSRKFFVKEIVKEAIKVNNFSDSPFTVNESHENESHENFASIYSKSFIGDDKNTSEESTSNEKVDKTYMNSFLYFMNFMFERYHFSNPYYDVDADRKDIHNVCYTSNTRWYRDVHFADVIKEEKVFKNLKKFAKIVDSEHVQECDVDFHKKYKLQYCCKDFYENIYEVLENILLERLDSDSLDIDTKHDVFTTLQLVRRIRNDASVKFVLWN